MSAQGIRNVTKVLVADADTGLVEGERRIGKRDFIYHLQACPSRTKRLRLDDKTAHPQMAQHRISLSPLQMAET